jgi:hypothetical protein
MAKGPSSFNLVSLLMLLAFAGGGYWVWKFFPAYFAAWQVDHALNDAAARSYKISRMKEPYQTQEKSKLVSGLREKIVALGVNDPELDVQLVYDGDAVTVSADYRWIVLHPVGGRFTVLTMHRQIVGDLKKVDWDN